MKRSPDPDHSGGSPGSSAKVNFPQNVAAAEKHLQKAEKGLRHMIEDEFMMTETPLEVQTAMEIALDDLGAAIKELRAIVPEKTARPAVAGGPTRQQGQFLAFIREFIMRNQAGVAPSHAEFQRFFNLTPPSVNSMLIRLEQRGFIRRIPGKARAIEVLIDPECIPPLDRPFKFRVF